MDFSQLSRVTDEIRTGKKAEVFVGGRVVKDRGENPLDQLEVREKITDSERVVIIDKRFIDKLKSTPREKRRRFLSRLTDAQRARVLKLVKMADSSNEELGYITFDTLLANYMYNPSDINKGNIDKFVETQEYFPMTDELTELVKAVEEDEELPQDGINQLIKGLNGVDSRLVAFSGESIELPEGDEFEVPEEEELTEEDKTTLEDSAKRDAKICYKEGSFIGILDAAEDLLAEFQGKNRSYKDSSKVYWKAFEEAWKEQYANDKQEITDALQVLKEIADEEKLDKIFDNPAVDGVEVKDIEDRSVLSLLVEALESFADGSSEKLEALLQQTMREEVEPEDEEPDEEDEDEKDEEEETEEFEELTEENEEKVEDAVHKLLLRVKRGKKVNKLVDALHKICPALVTMNLKIEDCCECVTVAPTEGATVADTPLTYEEFYSTHASDMCPVVACALAEEKPIVWPFKDWKVDGECINCDGRKYRPYTCSVEEVAQRLEEAADDPTRVAILGSTSVPLNKFRQVAAKCDALHLIDKRFYRPSLGASEWQFNGNIQDLLGDSVTGTRFRRSLPGENTIQIFGASYEVV